MVHTACRYKASTSQEEINFTPYNHHILKKKALAQYAPVPRWVVVAGITVGTRQY